MGSYLQKCMYPVLDRPFLELTLESLIRGTDAGTKGGRVTFIVGHYADQIRTYFGDHYEGLDLNYIEQKEPLGTGHAVHLAHAAHQYREPVTIWLADSYHRPERFQEIQDCSYENALTLARHECEFQHNERVDVEGDQVVRSWQGTSPFLDIGLWRFGPEMLDGMVEGKADEYRAMLNVQKAIEKGVSVGALFSPEWIHLGGAEPSFEVNVREVTRFFLDEHD